MVIWESNISLLSAVPLIKTFLVTTSVAGSAPGGIDASKSDIAQNFIYQIWVEMSVLFLPAVF